MKYMSWKQMIEYCAQGDEIIYNTLDDEQLERKFDCGWGHHEGVPFTAWSEEWVYFPVVYDGAEWVARVPRNPCDIETEHIVSE